MEHAGETCVHGAGFITMSHSIFQQAVSAAVASAFLLAMLITAHAFAQRGTAKVWNSPALQLAAMKRPPT
jgi:hypothetical protein